MYPIKLKPATKAYIWGGKALKEEWNKQSDSDIIAESWELSCHKDGQSIVDNGEFKGKTLSEVVDANKDFLGNNGKKFQFFPVLIKLIDAASNLSIQVHPSDEYALKNEGQFGKTEMWYVVDAKQGAGVYCGFKKPYSMEEVEKALKENKILDVLNFIEVKKGDCIFIPSGTVHAICGGLLICEIQQNSSLTYRLYDYDRVDKNGNKRELHIDKSLKVIDSTKVCKVNEEVKVVSDSEKLLATCKYFTGREYEVNGEKQINMTDDSFASVTVVKGNGSIVFDGVEEKANLGDTFFIPAGNVSYTLKGNMTVVEARV